MKEFLIKFINNKTLIYTMIGLIMLLSLSFNYYLYFKNSNIDNDIFKKINALEAINEIKKKELLNMLDSLNKKNNFLDIELIVIKKENDFLKKSLMELKKDYDTQKIEIDKFIQKNEKTKISVPVNIDELWK